MEIPDGLLPWACVEVAAGRRHLVDTTQSKRDIFGPGPHRFVLHTDEPGPPGLAGETGVAPVQAARTSGFSLLCPVRFIHLEEGIRREDG